MTVREYIGSVKRITGALERSNMELRIVDAHKNMKYSGKIDMLFGELLDEEVLQTIMVSNLFIMIYVPYVSKEIKELETV